MPVDMFIDTNKKLKVLSGYTNPCMLLNFKGNILVGEAGVILSYEYKSIFQFP